MGWRKCTKLGLISLLGVSLVALSACGQNSTSGQAGGNGGGDIVVGAIGPVSGSTAQYGDSMKKNIELYFDEVNKAGGINGKKIKLIFEDDGGKPDQGINAVKRLIETDHVVAVLGSPLSAVTLATMRVTQEAKIPQIVTSSGNPKITDAGDPYLVRVVPKDSAIAAAVTRYAVSSGFKKLGILHGSDEYGKGGGDAAIQTLQSMGLSPAAVETFNPGDKDFTAQLTKFKQAGIQGLIFWGFYQEGALIAKQAKSLGLNAQIFAGTGVNNPKFIELAGDAGDGVLMGTPFTPSDPTIKDYVSAYTGRYGQQPDMTGACGYDAAQLIVAAIKAVGPDSERINQWLHQVKDFKGVTGTLTTDSHGDMNNEVKVVAIHKDGKQSVIWDPSAQK